MDATDTTSPQNQPVNTIVTRSMLKAANSNKPAMKDAAVQTDDPPKQEELEEEEDSFITEEETETDDDEYSEYDDDDEEEDDDDEDEEEDDEDEDQQNPMRLQVPFMLIVNPSRTMMQPFASGNDYEEEEDCENGQCGCDGEEFDYDEREENEGREGREGREDREDEDHEGRSSKRRRGKKGDTIPTHFTPQERAYFRKLPKPQQESVLAMHQQMESQTKEAEKVPLKFRILQSDADPATKSLILKKMDNLQRMHPGGGEYSKLRNWLDGVSRLPLGKYHDLPISPSDPTEKIADFLQGVRKSLDETVYGHQDTKDEILKTFARWISSPGSRGNCIGLVGAPGVGKTNIIKEGLCKALGMKFGFVSLGGCADGAFLDGHSFVYEGSQYGKIAEILMKTQCMNPILFFDEVDKISATRKGEEITGILTHLTDSTQNERFNDRYFTEIDLNLSKCLTVFSFNDESLVNPILRDRMTIIHVKGYNKKDKLVIARDYLIPKLLKDFNLTKDDIQISDAVIEKIIEKLPTEEGVRDLKRALESIIGWINMNRFIPEAKTNAIIKLPFEIKTDHLETYMKGETFRTMMQEHVLQSMYM